MSKSTIAGVAVVLVLIIGLGAYAAMHDSDDAAERGGETMVIPATPTTAPTALEVTPTPSTAAATTPSAPTPTVTATPVQASGHSLADVAAHASRDDCWVAVNGNVYNLTAWIAQHPGGPAAIVKMCGTDGSAAFNKQHGGQAQANAALAQFKIGALR